MDNKEKILGFLGKNIGKLFTMHELSIRLKVPYATFHRTIQEIGDLIIIENIGHSKIIKLNLNNPVIKSYLTISSDEEKKEFLSKHPLIKKIASELPKNETTILFGSYAKNKATENSDIDLMIINNGKTRTFSKYETLFNKKINPIFVTKKEFQLMLKTPEENVAKQALLNNIILNNPEEFWEVVLNVARLSKKIYQFNGAETN